MRTLAGLTLAIMACMTLWSCDQQQAQAPAAPPPPPQACNCQPVPPVANIPAPPAPVMTASVHRRHHHHYYASEQIQPGDAGYVSHTDESYQESYSESSVSAPPPPPVQGGRMWVDGYGRAHFWSRGEIAHSVYQANYNAGFEGRRMDPWHKFWAHCDDDRR